MFEQLLIFIPAAAIVALAPGPDNVGTMSIGLSRGRGAAFAFALGCASGCLTHTLWVSIGVAAAIKASPIAFTILKLAGAAYLACLGVMSIRYARTSTRRFAEAAPAVTESSFRFWRRGFLANAINPKVALFFLTFLPSFIRTGSGLASPALQVVVFGVTFAAVTVAIFGSIACFAAAVGRSLREHPMMGRRLDQFSGIVFLGLAAFVLVQQRV